MDWTAQIAPTIATISQLIFLLNALLHIIFAAGVARDVAQFNRIKASPHFVSGMIWVLATLIGGVFVLLVYWLIHHSSLGRSTFMSSKENTQA